MLTRQSILSCPTYWLTEIRLDLMRAVENFQQARHLSHQQLAEHLHCSATILSELLAGNFNASLEQLCEIALAVGKIPLVRFEELDAVLAQDAAYI